jgi:hypothetical protein
MNIFQFVQRIDRAFAVMNGDAAHFLERRRVPQPDLRRAVAHIDLMPIVGHAPAFPGIFEFPNPLKTIPVVDEAPMRLPRELKDSLIEQRDPFAEVFRSYMDFLQDLSRRQFHLPKT